MSVYCVKCIGLIFCHCVLCVHARRTCNPNNLEETIMWTTPAATEMRFGFEVTMYVMNK